MTFAHDLRNRIRQLIGIPNCIGIGPTRTIAKLANKVAKKGAGVVDLSYKREREVALRDFPTGDLWGVGRKWDAKLAILGMTTAAHIRDAPDGLILERFWVVLARTQRELQLQGIPCAGIEEIEPDRQQIMVSRSFGERVEDHEAVGQEIATFAIRCGHVA